MALNTFEAKKLEFLEQRWGPLPATADGALGFALAAEQLCRDLGPFDPAVMRFKREQQDWEAIAELLEKRDAVPVALNS